jgi:glucose-1-phosphate thymidylyltransferase
VIFFLVAEKKAETTVTKSDHKGVQREVVGLIPAAGQATRVAPLPCSKELFPIGFELIPGETSKRPKVVCQYLLEKLRIAGVSKAYIVLREGKWDIPAYLRDGSALEMHLAYLMMGVPFGVPYTLDQAYPFVQEALVAFGFPDIIFQPDDAFMQLLAYQAGNDADIIIGLFPAEQPHKVDMVDFDEGGRVRQIVKRPHKTTLRYSWGIAVWTPIFTHFLHEYITGNKAVAATHSECSLGDVIQAAIQERLHVAAVPVADIPYLDIGTLEDLSVAVQRFSS